ncbi:hypothetical protein ID866_7003 [Astraeus odoratus]|nr:hypothetical protein ID866_7003 [Astraeus odoratus]
MSFLTWDTFDAFSDAAQVAALNTTRLAASSLPPDLTFHRSIDPSLGRDIDALSTRVLELTDRLIQLVSKVNSRQTTSLEGEEDVVDEFPRRVVDTMEAMLERTDSALDEMLGKKKGPAIQIRASRVDSHQNNETKNHQAPSRGRLDPAITHASHLPKPQLKFRYRFPNTDESPYLPVALIPHKWCAKVPLGYVFADETSKCENIDGKEEEDEKKRRSLHPYYHELTHPTYPEHIFDLPANPERPPPLELPSNSSSASRTFTFITNTRAFFSFAHKIANATELAVDLEHHSYRSYRGFLALMQVSTRQEDFVVDLLVPEIREGLRQGKGKTFDHTKDEQMAREAGEIVARVFADPSIIKVFHGADSDIVWLQQDFNIFVVGLFDTFHASKLLELPKHSLANLLETYCDFVPDKRYQLADWRIRPLPAEMLSYAVSDTHFLLYIYDQLRLALVDKAQSHPPSELCPDTGSHKTGPHDGAYTLIRSVLARSARTSLRLYEVEAYDAEGGSGSGGWDTLARKWNKLALTATGVYRAVHRWRESVAKQEDESTRYVLPTHHVFLIAEHLPSSASDLLSLFGAHGSVPAVLKRRAGELVNVVKAAMDKAMIASLEQPIKTTASAVATVDTSTEYAQDNGGGSIKVTPTISELRLWSSSSYAARSHSTLFGVASSPKMRTMSDKAGTYTTANSALLGDVSQVGVIMSRRPKSALMPTATTDQFKNIVEKIHRTLVIAPVVTVPSTVVKAETAVPCSPDAALVDSDGSVTNSLTTADQIEIAVPEHQRQSRSFTDGYSLTADDTIVVVGQANARQRKRKREKNRSRTSQSDHHAGSDAVITDQEAKTAAFDYSSAPNLLDGGESDRLDEGSSRKSKKAKQNRDPGFTLSAKFRALPRDQREVKNGNKTHTFR